MAKRRSAAEPAPQVDAYPHPQAESPMRPDADSEPHFRKRKPPATYRYDSSLAPALDWDGQNPARERDDALLCQAFLPRTGAWNDLKRSLKGGRMMRAHGAAWRA